MVVDEVLCSLHFMLVEKNIHRHCSYVGQNECKDTINWRTASGVV